MKMTNNNKNDNNHYNYYYFHYKYKYNLKSLDSIKQKRSAQTTNLLQSSIFFVCLFVFFFYRRKAKGKKKKDLKHTVSQTERCMLYGTRKTFWVTGLITNRSVHFSTETT